MNILISGICGALGSRLAEKALISGHAVTGLKRSTSDIMRIAPIKANIKLYNIDITTDMSELEKNKFDILVHTITNYGRLGETLSNMSDVNVQLPMKLLHMAKRIEVKRFLNCGTSLDRDNNNYSRTKAHFADLGKDFAKNSSINFINAKLGTFFGDMFDPKQFATFIIKQCLMNAKVIDLTLGQQIRDFIHIDDVVSALLFIINYENTQKITDLYVGGGEVMSIRDFSERVREITGAQSELNFGGIISTEERNQVLDNRGADLREFGWKASLTIEQGIKKTIDNYVENN